MDIVCPHCDFSRSVSPDKIPDRPVKVTCPKCNQGFSFDMSALPSKPEEFNQVTPASGQTSCPACGLNQPKADSCSGCGVIYSRLQARQEENCTPVGTGDNLAALRQKAMKPPPQLAPKAGFWIRVVSYFIDSALIFAVNFTIGLGLGLTAGVMGVLSQDGDTTLSMITGLCTLVIGVTYSVFFTGYCGQTPGKMALRIKVIRTDGSDLSYGRAALREIPGKFISSILFCIGYIMVAFDSKKQGLHDKMADTYVIKL